MGAAGNSLDQALLQGFQRDMRVIESPTWMVLHKLSMYIDCPYALLSVVEQLTARLINLLSSE